MPHGKTTKVDLTMFEAREPEFKYPLCLASRGRSSNDWPVTDACGKQVYVFDDGKIANLFVAAVNYAHEQQKGRG